MGGPISVFVIIVSLLCIQAQAEWTISDEGCKTPGKGSGECIPIHQCNSIKSFLEYISNQEGNLSSGLIELLKSYQCGFHSNVIKVCCPEEVYFAEPLIARFLTEEPPPKDPNNHPNLSLLSYDCGTTDLSDRISGGNKTALGEFPWMTLINYQTGREPSFKCGGTIINDRYILTAAHCISNLTNSLKPISVRVGEHNVSSLYDCDFYSSVNGTYRYCAPPVQDILIEEVLPHPEFNPAEFVHDVGLLRLATPINIDEVYAKPICLPIAESSRNKNFTNSKLTITGWGLTETGRVSDILLKVNIPMLDISECQKAYQRTTANVSSLHLCGGGKNRQDSCGGDSGGPLQRIDNYNDDARFIQFGIVSFGAKTCGRVGVPAVYTRLDRYLDWILDTIRP